MVNVPGKSGSGPPPLPSATSENPIVPPPLPGTRPPQDRSGGPKTMPADVYVPDRGKVRSVKWLAAILASVVVFSLSPVAYHAELNLQTAPGWARLVVLTAVLQAAYIAWMLNRPDWASVRVVMLVFAAVAVMYAVAAATVMTTPAEQSLILAVDEVRQAAGKWCLAVSLAMVLVSYLCGHNSGKWRRSLRLQRAAGKNVIHVGR